MHLHNMRAEPQCKFLPELLLHRRVISNHTYKDGIVSYPAQYIKIYPNLYKPTTIYCNNTKCKIVRQFAILKKHLKLPLPEMNGFLEC